MCSQSASHTVECTRPSTASLVGRGICLTVLSHLKLCEQGKGHIQSVQKKAPNMLKSLEYKTQGTVEISWFVQLKAEEAEGRSHGSLQLLMRGVQG